MNTVEQQKKIQKSLSRNVAVVILCAERDRASSILDCGTLSLIQFPHEKLFVTAFHVWDSFVNADPPGFIAACCSEPNDDGDCFEISKSEIIAESQRPRDLVVLRPPFIKCLENCGKTFATVNEWPPRIPEVCETVMVLGSPGEFREDISTQDRQLFAMHGFSLELKITGYSDFALFLELGCKFDDPHLNVWNPYPIDWHSINWGGLSGAPVYAKGSDDSFRPCAILTDASDGIEGRFIATKLDCLDDRGRLG